MEAGMVSDQRKKTAKAGGGQIAARQSPTECLSCKGNTMADMHQQSPNQQQVEKNQHGEVGAGSIHPPISRMQANKQPS